MAACYNRYVPPHIAHALNSNRGYEEDNDRPTCRCECSNPGHCPSINDEGYGVQTGDICENEKDENDGGLSGNDTSETSDEEGITENEEDDNDGKISDGDTSGTFDEEVITEDDVKHFVKATMKVHIRGYMRIILKRYFEHLPNSIREIDGVLLDWILGAIAEETGNSVSKIRRSVRNALFKMREENVEG